MILRRVTAAIIAAVVLVQSAGCVQRRMTIRTNAPGAQVYVDNQEIGRTPVSTDFVYYGDRSIRLVKDGFETLTVEQPVPPPWYQFPGIDFFVENVWPFEIRDERHFDYQLQPQYVVPTETLMTRAEELRRNTAASIVPATNASPYAVTPGTSAPGVIAPPQYLTPPAGGTTTPQPTLPGAPASGASGEWRTVR